MLCLDCKERKHVDISKQKDIQRHISSVLILFSQPKMQYSGFSRKDGNMLQELNHFWKGTSLLKLKFSYLDGLYIYIWKRLTVDAQFIMWTFLEWRGTGRIQERGVLLPYQLSSDRFLVWFSSLLMLWTYLVRRSLIKMGLDLSLYLLFNTSGFHATETKVISISCICLTLLSLYYSYYYLLLQFMAANSRINGIFCVYLPLGSCCILYVPEPLRE